MIDKDQVPHLPGATDRGASGLVPPPGGGGFPESLWESPQPRDLHSPVGIEPTTPTLVPPRAAVEHQQSAQGAAGPVEDPTEPTIVEVQPETAGPGVSASPTETTAVISRSTPVPPSSGTASAPGGYLVPPPGGMVPPPTDDEVTLTDTDDFTLSDITFSDVTLGDVTGNHALAWLQGLGSKLSSLVAGRRQAADPARSKRAPWGLKRWQFGLLASVAGLVLLFALFVAVDGGVYYNKVHHGVKVAGRSLSGMGEGEAAASLAAFVEEARHSPITLVSGENRWEVLPDEVGTTIDIPAAVSAAMGLTRGGNALTDFGKKLGLYFDDEDIPLPGSVDEGKMDALLATVADELDVPPTNARLVIVGDSLLVEDGEPGTVVDTEALRAGLTELLFAFHSTELEIPMVAVNPDVNAVDISPALAQANVMISSDLVLTYDGAALATFGPRDIASYMDLLIEEKDGVTTTTPVLSPTKMSAFFDSIEDKVGTPGVNATLDSDGESVWVVPGHDGEGLDRETTAAALTTAALNSTGRKAEAALKTVPPDLTTEKLEAMGITDLLSSYATTPYTGTSNRQINVRLATKLASGILLAPGEEFNTDKRLGKRDAAHGWATAPGITGFAELEDVYGGGICQVSTTLFNAVFEAGLEIVERHNHSIYINHYPDGRDATVTAGGKNMRFRNDTDNYIFIYGESTGIRTKFYIWGVDDGRTVKIDFSGFYSVTGHTATTILNPALAPGTQEEVFSGQNGRKCHVTRTVTYADGTTKTEKFSSSYPSMPRITEVGPALTTTTGSPTTTGSTTPTTAPPPTTASTTTTVP